MRKIIIRTNKPMEFDFFTFDVETRGLNAKALKFVGAWWQGEYRRFTTAGEFWEWIGTLPKCYGYAYNANYDLCSLLDNPLFDLKNYIDVNGRFVAGKYGKVTFADASNLLHTLQGKEGALRQIAATYGHEIPDLPASLLDEDQYQISFEEVEKNEADCRVLHAILEQFFGFVREYASPRPLTLAANSLRIWQESFCPIATAHSKGLQIMVSDLDDYFRQAYYGGRCEVYEKGQHHDVGMFDVNSMYPSVMRGNYPIPAELQYRNTKHLSPGDFDRIIWEEEGMAIGVATVPDDWRYGPLPLRTASGRTVYPTGTFRGAWCFPELRALLGLGGGFVAEEAVFSRGRCYPFADFVNTFYAKKQFGNDWERLQTKLLLNSLYGKLGAAGQKQEVFQRRKETLDRDTADQYSWFPFDPENEEGAGYWIRESASEHGYNSILCLAAYTTSHARVEHWRGLLQSAAIYGDTDSCFTRWMPVPTVFPDAIGAWREVGRAKWIKLYATKAYELENQAGDLVQRCKGVPRRYISKLFEGYLSKVDLRIEKLRSPREAAHSSLAAGTPYHFLQNINLEDSRRCWRHSRIDSDPHKYGIIKSRNIQLCCRED